MRGNVCYCNAINIFKVSCFFVVIVVVATFEWIVEIWNGWKRIFMCIAVALIIHNPFCHISQSILFLFLFLHLKNQPLNAVKSQFHFHNSLFFMFLCYIRYKTENKTKNHISSPPGYIIRENSTWKSYLDTIINSQTQKQNEMAFVYSICSFCSVTTHIIHIAIYVHMVYFFILFFFLCFTCIY